MKRLTITLLILSCLLAACTGSPFTTQRNVVQDYNTGTDGLILDFVEQAPPVTISEGGEFDVQVEVTNAGSFDLTDEYAAQVRLRDPDSAKLESKTQSASLPGSYVGNSAIQLEGKNIAYPNGESRIFALERFSAKGITGNFQTNKVNLNVELCYPYQTSFSDNVCVDTNADGNDLRRQSCQAQDQTYSGGQGAPLAVTAIESIMAPSGAYIEPQFVIHVAHEGEGRIEFFQEEQASFLGVFQGSSAATACGAPQPDAINKFYLEARLGGQELECSISEDDEGIYFLRDGKARVTCRYADSEILASTASYSSILEVDLFYQYREDFSSETTVVRSGLFDFGNGRESATNPDDCYPWEQYTSVDGESRCVTSCRYYADQPNSAHMSELIEANFINPVMSRYVDCVYNSAEACRAADELCILEQNLCAPGSYCGFPSCLNDNHAPKVLERENPDDSRLQWFCSDRDDEDDPKGTCGCDDVAYYAFVNKDQYRDCDELPDSLYTEVEGDRNSFMMSYEVSLAEGTEDDFLCIKVVDRLGDFDTKRMRYPFNGYS
jgi:hypothetical protein